MLSRQSSVQQQPVCTTTSHLPTQFFQQCQLLLSVSAVLLISLIFSCRFSPPPPRSRTAVSTLSLISLRIFSKLTLLKGSNVWQRISWKVISAAGTAFCVRFLLSQEFYSQQCINGVISYLSAACREMLVIQAHKILICKLGSKSTSVCSCHPRPCECSSMQLNKVLSTFPLCSSDTSFRENLRPSLPFYLT